MSIDPPAPLDALVETSLYGDDLVAMEAFYATTLGLPVVVRDPQRHVFLRVGAGSMLLIFKPDATLTPGQFPVHGATGPGHVALGIPAADLDRWRQYLVGQRIPIEQEFTWPRGGHSLYFRDPAGNSVELITPGVWGTPAGW